MYNHRTTYSGINSGSSSGGPTSPFVQQLRFPPPKNKKKKKKEDMFEYVYIYIYRGDIKLMKAIQNIHL